MIGGKGRRVKELVQRDDPIGVKGSGHVAGTAKRPRAAQTELRERTSKR